MNRQRDDRSGTDGMFEHSLPRGPGRPKAGEASRPTPADLPPHRPVVDEAPTLSAAVDALELSIAIIDPDGVVGYASDALSQLLGVPAGRILHRRLGTVLPGLEKGEPAALLRHAFTTGEPFALRLEHGVGSARRTLAIRASRTSDGRLALDLSDATGSISRDQTERAVFDGRARIQEPGVLASTVEENLLLRELAGRLADIPDSAILMRELSEIAIRECEAMGGCMAALRAGEVEILATVGSGMQKCGTTFPLAGSLIDDVVETQRLRRGRLNELADHQHMVIPEQGNEVMIAPLIAYDQVVGVLAVVRGRCAPSFTDQDERRLQLVTDHAALALWRSRLVEQALAANDARSNFLATISHELRTPITALIGYGELLADEISGSLSDGQMEMVERVRSVTHGLAAIVDELLSFSSLEDGRERPRMLDVDSGGLLQAAVAVVEPAARQKGLRVRTTVPALAPPVYTDPEKVRQILVNLAGNAVKFTDQGEVSFSIEHDAHEVRFLVRDTGPGIPPGAQERIFEPFTQLDSGLTRRHGGTGLGLYVASRLAGLLGGRIELGSQPGQGASFVLVLPRRAGC